MLIFVLLASMFTANDWTANDLKQYCASTLQMERTYCLGYIRGFHDGVNFAIAEGIEMTAKNRIAEIDASMDSLMGCSGQGRVTLEQMKLVFLKYVDNHPELLHWP